MATGHIATSLLSTYLRALAAIEVEGIIGATVPRVAREAFAAMQRGLRPAPAWLILSRTFDDVAPPRMRAACDDLVVGAVARSSPIGFGPELGRTDRDAEFLPVVPRSEP